MELYECEMSGKCERFFAWFFILSFIFKEFLDVIAFILWLCSYSAHVKKVCFHSIFSIEFLRFHLISSFIHCLSFKGSFSARKFSKFSSSRYEKSQQKPTMVRVIHWIYLTNLSIYCNKNTDAHNRIIKEHFFSLVHFIFTPYWIHCNEIKCNFSCWWKSKTVWFIFTPLVGDGCVCAVLPLSPQFQWSRN